MILMGNLFQYGIARLSRHRSTKQTDQLKSTQSPLLYWYEAQIFFREVWVDPLHYPRLKQSV
jgi:hypothetical protein